MRHVRVPRVSETPYYIFRTIRFRKPTYYSFRFSIRENQKKNQKKKNRTSANISKPKARRAYGGVRFSLTPSPVCRRFVLNTDGRGWATAATTTSGSPGATADDLNDGFTDEFVDNPCDALYPGPTEPDGRRTVPVPAFDDDARPGSLAVPFAVGQRLFDVDDGRPVLVRYYRLAAACAAAGGAGRFRRDARRWLDASVAPLLARRRRRWYPVLAGAARVVRAAAENVTHGPTPSDSGPRRRRYAIGAADGPDPDWPACDDDDRPVDWTQPNVYVFALIVAMSLSVTWTLYGLYFVL